MQRRPVTYTKAILSLKVCIMQIYRQLLIDQLIRCCCNWKHLVNLHYLHTGVLEMTEHFRAMTHDEEKYPSPHEFKPERFLRDDGSLTSDTMPLGFGWGRRLW
jgi:hypothetical protein